MTIEEFRESLKKKKGFMHVLNYMMSIAVILTGLIMILTFGIADSSPFEGFRNLALLSFSALILLGLLGLYALSKKYRLTYLSNNLAKQENIVLINRVYSKLAISDESPGNDHIRFTIKYGGWNLKLEIHLFADIHLIAIYVEGKEYGDKAIDIRASDKLSKKITGMIEKQAFVSRVESSYIE